MAVSLTTIPIECPKVRQSQQTNPLGVLAHAIVSPNVFQLLGVPNVNTAKWSTHARINVHRHLETNKCARCVVPAEYFSNVRAFLSTSHEPTAWTLGAHLHSQARTAVADSTGGTGSLAPTSRHLGPHASHRVRI
jgi:hypothetical protein